MTGNFPDKTGRFVVCRYVKLAVYEMFAMSSRPVAGNNPKMSR